MNSFVALPLGTAPCGKKKNNKAEDQPVDITSAQNSRNDLKFWKGRERDKIFPNTSRVLGRARKRN